MWVSCSIWSAIEVNLVFSFKCEWTLTHESPVQDGVLLK